MPSGLQDPAVFGPETFIERVADDGMAPRISRGDYVYVDPDEPAVDGSVVLFGRGADAVVRRLVVEAGRLRGRACVRPTGEQGGQGTSVAETAVWTRCGNGQV